MPAERSSLSDLTIHCSDSAWRIWFSMSAYGPRYVVCRYAVHAPNSVPAVADSANLCLGKFDICDGKELFSLCQERKEELTIAIYSKLCRRSQRCGRCGRRRNDSELR